MSAQMRTAWLAFAREGDPGGRISRPERRGSSTSRRRSRHTPEVVSRAIWTHAPSSISPDPRSHLTPRNQRAAEVTTANRPGPASSRVTVGRPPVRRRSSAATCARSSSRPCRKSLTCYDDAARYACHRFEAEGAGGPPERVCQRGPQCRAAFGRQANDIRSRRSGSPRGRSTTAPRKLTYAVSPSASTLDLVQPSPGEQGGEFAGAPAAQHARFVRGIGVEAARPRPRTRGASPSPERSPRRTRRRCRRGGRPAASRPSRARDRTRSEGRAALRQVELVIARGVLPSAPAARRCPDAAPGTRPRSPVPDRSLPRSGYRGRRRAPRRRAPRSGRRRAPSSRVGPRRRRRPARRPRRARRGIHRC